MQLYKNARGPLATCDSRTPFYIIQELQKQEIRVRAFSFPFPNGQRSKETDFYLEGM